MEIQREFDHDDRLNENGEESFNPASVINNVVVLKSNPHPSVDWYKKKRESTRLLNKRTSSNSNYQNAKNYHTHVSF